MRQLRFQSRMPARGKDKEKGYKDDKGRLRREHTRIKGISLFQREDSLLAFTIPHLQIYSVAVIE